MALTHPSATVGQDTVEFTVLAERAAVEPFRTCGEDLVALFGVAEACTPWWHRVRAHDLRREAHEQTVAAVTDAYLRLAARHIATARLLESTGEGWAETA